MKNRNSKKLKFNMKLKFLILIFIMILCIYEIGSYTFNIYSTNQLNKEIKEIYQFSQIEESLEEDPPEQSTNDGTYKQLSFFNELLQINSDIVAWIKIPNTNIDYPVAKGTDNTFYLNHNIKKEPSISGSIFMDYRNSNESKDVNRIIYGHNMKDGSMFKNLTKYKTREHFLQHPIIELESLEESTRWEIFSVYITDTKFNYIQTSFKNIEEYQDFLHSVKNKSLYDTGISVDEKDRILTLSTCTYEFDNARFVIHGKKVE